MIAPTQIRKPENWQDFEKLCTKLWGEIWHCQDSIKRNGRSGQNQHGVDIYGIPEGKDGYYGIQCKGKSDYTKSELTESDVDAEIKNAKDFKPTLKRLIFATSACKDAKIEEYVRCKNIENINAELFGVDIFSWEDIVDKIKENRNVYNWYVNNMMYNDVCDVKVSIIGKEPITIHPKYSKIKITHQYQSRLSGFNIPSLTLPSIMQRPTEYDGRWCEIVVKVENIGATTIEDYVLNVWFTHNVDDLNNDVNLCMDFMIDSAVRESINNRQRDNQEVFYSEEYRNMLLCRPKKTILVEKDSHCFHIHIHTTSLKGDTKMYWEFLSRSYSKKGEISILIDAEYVVREEVREVSIGDTLPHDKEEISPMIKYNRN